MTGGRGGKDKDEREGGSIRRGDQEVGNKLAITVKALYVENVMSVAVWVHPVCSMCKYLANLYPTP